MKKSVCWGGSVFFAAAVVVIGANAVAATKTASKQSAIQNGTSVRTRVTPSGLYDQECYEAYYGCMDQFCIADNSNGGSCACSDDNEKYEKELTEIQSILEEAERVSTVEVEKVKAGAQADIIFTGTREYDENGNRRSLDELENGTEKDRKLAERLAIFQQSLYADDDEEDSVTDIMGKKGGALYAAAGEICLEQMPAKCEKHMTLLQQIYARQIVSDCTAFKNSLSTKRKEAELQLAAAQGDVRAALKESFDSANKYDLGGCMVEFKKCMQTEDACGKNWENCVFTIASENMQNNKLDDALKTKKVKNISTYDITESTMEIMSSKRMICERVLDQCMVVRDQVWPSFLREAAPTIRVAEQAAESKFRQSCLTDISNCIQKACRDDIAGKGVDTMDACLARPDMARSFCKVELEPCERMEPQIWAYVSDKLAAMRVDACTDQVKECFTADTRCGENFANCIGMDYDYIHDMCPVEVLTACKKNGRNITMDELDTMLMGLYLNIDNSMLDNCQEIIDRKMAEVCGSTTDCNRFASDDVLGTGSLRSQKSGNIYRVTGMISFGSIKMGDASGRTRDSKTRLAPGEIGVAEYMAQIRQKNSSVGNAEGIFTTIEEELNNIAGTINRTIEMIEQDQEIQYCISGRNLSQITGKDEKTAGRFPNLLTQVKMQIAIAALRQAQDNYNKKFTQMVADATKDASADLAEYMCHKTAQFDGVGTLASQVDTPLAPVFAISYEVGAGLTAADLTVGGTGHFESTSG